jgi:hypothetical protein
VRRHATCVLLALVILLCLQPQTARCEPRGTLILNGVLAPTSTTFSQTRTFTENSEEGRIEGQFNGRRGAGFELGIEYRVLRHVGLAVSYATLGRDTTSTFSASLPHPLYLARNRTATGSVDALTYSEKTVHAELVFAAKAKSLDVSVFGGAAFVRVDADLLRQPLYTQSYPYDSVSVTSVPALRSQQSPVGFGAGARIDAHLGTRFGFGLQGRYSRATARFAPEAGDTATIRTGGLTLAAGARIFF